MGPSPQVKLNHVISQKRIPRVRWYRNSCLHIKRLPGFKNGRIV